MSQLRRNLVAPTATGEVRTLRVTYRTTQNPDGTVTVESYGPLSRIWRAVRIAWAVVLLLVSIVLLAHAEWPGAGFAFLASAIVLPSVRRLTS